MAERRYSNPVVDDELVDWVIREEGFLSEPTDIGDGKITLGSGLTNPKWHNLYKQKGKWTKEDNRNAVREELENRRRWAEDTLPNWDKLPIKAKKAMLSYKYNYDFTANNSPKLFDAMKRADYLGAVHQMDATSKNPKFKKGLQERRQREQAWASEGLFPTPVPKLGEQTDVLRVAIPYSTALNETVAKPVYTPLTQGNYVEAKKLEPEEWQRENAINTFDTYARIKKLLDSQKWENQAPIQYVPSSGINYVADSYAEGGKIEKKKLWDELSMKEKADMIRVAVKNGITNLPNIRQKYNEFAEGGDTENEDVEESRSGG